MFEKSFCPVCGTELTGVIISTFVREGDSHRILPQETTDCNWTRCEACKRALCKTCHRAQLESCCPVDHVRDGANKYGVVSNLGDTLKRLIALINRSKHQREKN